MNTPANPSFLDIERFRHREYETVRSADLRDQEAVQDTLRDWHNRALHKTYGVSFGLEVQLTDDKPGSWTIRVAVGLAYDVFGRELALTQSANRVPVPLDPVALSLVLRAGDRGPILAWVPTNGFELTDGVAVAKTQGDVVKPFTLKNGAALPDLGGKVDYNATGQLITIHGLLSEPEWRALRDAADDKSKPVIDAVFRAWPLAAPRRSRSINSGLEVRVESGQPPAPLWQAVITGGSAVTDSGEVLELLETNPPLKLEGKEGESILVLRAGSPAAELALVANRPGSQDRAVELATLSLPDAAQMKLPEGLLEDKALEELRKQLTDSRKVKFDTDKIHLVGFLTQVERDQLVDVIAARDIGRVPEAHTMLAAQVEVNLADLHPERPPFFPIRSRPLARPRTATGQTIPGRTEWKECARDLFRSDPPQSVWKVFETTVSIEAAGFTQVPRLIAWLQETEKSQGERIAAGESDNGRPSLPPLVLFRGEIDDGTKNGGLRLTTKQFVFRVWLVHGLEGTGWHTVGIEGFTEYLRENVFVRWLAVQSEPAAPQDFRVKSGMGGGNGAKGGCTP